jgi:hypothetical protein
MLAQRPILCGRGRSSAFTEPSHAKREAGESCACSLERRLGGGEIPIWTTG